MRTAESNHTDIKKNIFKSQVTTNKKRQFGESNQEQSNGVTRTKLNYKDMTSRQIQARKQLKRERSYSILHYLQDNNKQLNFKYKQFSNHSKQSSLQQVKDIITELLNKHAVERVLSTSQQYILTGYLAKYIHLSNGIVKELKNPFNITERLSSNNSIQSTFVITTDRSISPKHNKSKTRVKLNKKMSELEEKKMLTNRQFVKIAFLWKVYQLKCLICVNLQRPQDDINHKEMLELMRRLSSIDSNRKKISQEKTLAQIQKVMRKFEQKIRELLK